MQNLDAALTLSPLSTDSEGEEDSNVKHDYSWPAFMSSCDGFCSPTTVRDIFQSLLETRVPLPLPTVKRCTVLRRV